MAGLSVLDIPLLGAHALGNYQLVAEIGRGGMADVFLALAPPVNGRSKRVVIKQVRSDALEDDDFRAMFLDEARLAQRLCHPNVVTTFEVGKEGDAYFIVMEFLDGQPLSRIRKHAHKLGVEIPFAAHLRILADVLEGLHYVHDLTDRDGVPFGVVHRDATPPNVFVTYDGQVKVVDFGIAKARARQVETRVGVVKGKLSYIAPENVRGDEVDRRSDIFSVGVMLWEAATGRRFWEGFDELSIYQRLASGELPTASGAADMSPQLYAIVERALAPNPRDRFATAAQMRSAIDALPALIASSAAVSGYLYQLFVEERRKFHQRVEEEVGRLEAGQWPTQLPNFRPESGPLSTTAGYRSGARSAPTARAENAAPNSATMRPIVTSVSSPMAPSVAAAARPPARVAFLFGAAVVAIFFAVYAPNQSSRAPRASARAMPVGAVPQAALPAPPAGSTVAVAASSAPAAPVSAPAAPLAAPPIVFRNSPMFARPLPKKAEAPDGFDESHRDLRRKRSLDTEDPWAN